MQRMTLAAVSAAALGAIVLTGCSTDDDDCNSQPAFIYVVGGVYHYGSPHGTVVDRRYVNPKTGTLKPGVSVKPGGKVSLDKSKISPNGKPVTGSKGGSGYGSKPGYKAPGSVSKGGGFGGGRTTSRR